MNTNAPANLQQLSALLRQGEGPALEFKRSTGELKEGMQTLCAFLNGTGGRALFGVRPDGKAEGPAGGVPSPVCVQRTGRRRSLPLPPRFGPGAGRRSRPPGLALRG